MNMDQLLALLVRLDRSRLSADASCADCGLTYRVCLALNLGEVLCQECVLRRHGSEPFEEHHLGGRPSPITVRVRANLHRLLTLLQDLWRDAIAPGSPE